MATEKWSGAAFTAADVADINASTSSFMGIGATVTDNFKITASKLAQWLRQTGFAVALAVATPAAVAWGFNSGSGVDNAAGNFTLTAPLSTGAATPATMIFQTGVVGSTGSTLQTATTGLTLTSSGAVPVGNFAGVVGIGTAGLAQNALSIGGTITAASAAARAVRITPTLVATANGDGITGFSYAVTVTPGAFTGLVYRGLNFGAFSTASWTSPAEPAHINFGALTGKAGADASHIILGAVTGGDINYLMRTVTASTFHVLASGAITTASTLTTGGGVQVGGQLTVGVPSVSGLQFISSGLFGTLDAIPLVLRTTSATRMTIAAGSGNITFTGDLSGIGALAMTGALSGAASLAATGGITTSGGQFTAGVGGVSGVQIVNDGTIGTLDALPLTLRTTSATRVTIAADGSLMTLASGLALKLGNAAAVGVGLVSSHTLTVQDSGGTTYRLMALV